LRLAFALTWPSVIRLDHSTKKLNLHINIIWGFLFSFLLFGLSSAFHPFIKQKEQERAENQQ